MFNIPGTLTGIGTSSVYTTAGMSSLGYRLHFVSGCNIIWQSIFLNQKRRLQGQSGVPNIVNEENFMKDYSGEILK